MASARSPRTTIRTENQAGERADLNSHWRGLFLATLAETSNVSAAAAGEAPSVPLVEIREEL